MRLSVLILLSILSVQGRGSKEILFKEGIRKLVSHIRSQEATREFRKVFPRNYEIAHSYNDSLLCDSDPCCVFSSAAVLSDSWSELLNVLWRENHQYSFINDLKKQLDEISAKKFQDMPDFSMPPSVSSSPEILLGYTEAVFSKWLDQDSAAVTELLCTFPTLLTGMEEDDLYERTTEGKRTTTLSSFLRHKSPADGMTSVHSSVSVFGHLSLLWAIQQTIF